MTPSEMMQPFEQCFTAAFSHERPPIGYHHLLDGYPQGDFQPTFYNPFEIKHRRRTSKAQLKILEKSFAENPKPNATVRRILAQKLDMTPRGVQIWFQNRRAKAKKLRRRQAERSPGAVGGEDEDDEDDHENGMPVLDYSSNLIKPECCWYDLTAPLMSEPQPLWMAPVTTSVPKKEKEEEDSDLWLTMPVHPLSTPERWIAFPSEDWRQKSCSVLQDMYYPMPSQRCFSEPHEIPSLQEQGASGENGWPEHCPVDFYPSLPATQPQQQQQQLTPLLSAGSGSPLSMDGYNYYSYDTDALLSLI